MAPNSSDNDYVKELELYHKHFTDLFVYQARQRIDSTRFFMLAVAILANALVISGSSALAKPIISFTGGVVSIIFLRLDYRNNQIVDINEKPLKYLQSIAKQRMKVSDSWCTFEMAHKNRKFGTTYGFLMPFLYSLIWVAWFSSCWVFTNRALNMGWGSKASIAIGLFLALIGLASTLMSKPKAVPDVQKLEEVEISPAA